MPHEVVDHDVVFVLTSTIIVSVKVSVKLTKPIVLEVKMEHADDVICTLPSSNSFVNDKIDLAWNTFTANPKQSSFPRCEEVNQTGLLG